MLATDPIGRIVPLKTCLLNTTIRCTCFQHALDKGLGQGANVEHNRRHHLGEILGLIRGGRHDGRSAQGQGRVGGVIHDHIVGDVVRQGRLFPESRQQLWKTLQNIFDAGAHGGVLALEVTCRMLVSSLELAQQLLRRSLGVHCAHNTSHHGNAVQDAAVRAGRVRHSAAGVVMLDAANDDRAHGVVGWEGLEDRAHANGAQGALGGLCLSHEASADPDIIRAVGQSLLCLLWCAGRDTQDFVGAEEAAGLDAGDIVLSNVDALGVNGQGDIDVVIDQKRDIVLCCFFFCWTSHFFFFRVRKIKSTIDYQNEQAKQRKIQCPQERH